MSNTVNEIMALADAMMCHKGDADYHQRKAALLAAVESMAAELATTKEQLSRAVAISMAHLDTIEAQRQELETAKEHLVFIERVAVHHPTARRAYCWPATNRRPRPSICRPS